MPVRMRKNGSSVQNVLDFLTKNWLVILAVIFVLPIVLRYMQNWMASEAQREKDAIRDDPQKLQDALATVTDDDNMKVAAKQIYEAYSIPEHWYEWLLPSKWSENDALAYSAILSVTPGGFNVPDELYKCYYLVSGGRDLFKDSQKYLNDAYFKLITW